MLHGRWIHLRGLRFPRESDLALARRALAAVGLASFETRDVASLSGGEHQRAMLARALAQESPLLLLDEPTANLDVHQRVEVLQLLRAAHDFRGLGRVIVTHDLELAGSVADRAVLLKEGKVLAAGPVEDVLKRDLLEEAFGHRVRIDAHPDTGKPRVTVRLP